MTNEKRRWMEKVGKQSLLTISTEIVIPVREWMNPRRFTTTKAAETGTARHSSELRGDDESQQCDEKCFCGMHAACTVIPG